MSDTHTRHDGEDRRHYPESLRVELRREIVEAQKIGANFLKWKLIAMATVSSVAVGFWSAPVPTGTEAKLLLCLIPLICAYVDMVSLDLAVRTMVIANFLRTKCHDAYEKHVHGLRDSGRNPFGAAPIVVHGSSIASSLIIAGLGLYGAYKNWDRVEVAAFQMFGVLGIALAMIQAVLHSHRVSQIDDGVQKQRAAKGSGG